MSTVAQLVEEVRLHLYGTHQSQVNRLLTTVNSSTTTIALEFPVNYVVPGGVIAIEDEVMLVWSINQVGKELTVQRGYNGTTAAAHTAPLMVEINPRFPTTKIRNALVSEIRSWGMRLWAVANEEITLSASIDRAYDLGAIPTSMIHILDVLKRPTTAGDTWKHVAGRVERNLPVADFASTMAFITEKNWGSTGTFVVTYAYPLVVSTFTDATNLQTTVKMESAWEDIAAMGAAWRLVLPREIKRTFTESQGEAKDSAEVPPGHITQTASALKQMRDMRIAEEIRVLAGKYPWRVG